MSLDANRSFSGVPLSWQILWNSCWASFNSKESRLFIDFQSAVTFSLLWRYSAIRLVQHWRRCSHISFTNWTSFEFWIRTIFNRYGKATMLSTWRWMTLCFKVFENFCIVSFMDKSSRTFMWFFNSWEDHILPVEILLHLP